MAKIEAIIPLCANEPFGTPFKDRAALALKQFESASGKIKFELDVEVSELLKLSFITSREVRSKSPEILDQSKRWPNFEHRFLKLSTNIKLKQPPKDIQVGAEGGRVVSGYIHSLETGFVHRIRDLLLCACIAVPGGIRAEPGVLLIGGKYHGNINGFYTSLSLVYEDAQKIGWPPLSDTSLERVWNWFLKLEGVELGMGKGSVGRAVAAFSHLAEEKLSGDDKLRLMWAMLGLEAIYGRDASGVKSQLIEKSQVLLGPIKQSKKIFSRMYDYRSRFVHGDIDIPFSYSRWDGVPGNWNFHTEQDIAGLLAEALLVATLQQLAEKGLTTAKFSYFLNPDKSNVVE